VELKELDFNCIKCLLFGRRKTYLSSYIYTITQYKKNEALNSLYFLFRSQAFIVLSGSCQGHGFLCIASVSLYQIKGSFKICLMAGVYKGHRGQFLFIKESGLSKLD